MIYCYFLTNNYNIFNSKFRYNFNINYPQYSKLNYFYSLKNTKVKFKKLYIKNLYKLARLIITNKRYRIKLKQNWRFNFYKFIKF